ncbi:MAG: hypothetical protein ACFFC7_11880 [Candidatus Hermodarchaeota archaeon]
MSLIAYLTRLRKKMIQRGLPSKVVEEFFDNYADQLQSMVENLIEERILSVEEAEQEVLKQCESDEVIIQQVMEELELPQRLGTNQSFFQFTFLQTIDHLLVDVFKPVKIAYKEILTYYNEHRSPLLTAILGFLAIFVPLFLFLVFFPPLYNPSYGPLSYTLIITIPLSALVMTYVGWKYGSSYGIKTAGYLSLLRILLFTIVERPRRLGWIIQYSLPIKYGWSASQDWYFVFPPTFENYIFDFIDLIFIQELLVYLAFFIVFALIGAGLYHVKSRGLRLSSIHKKYLFLANCGLLLICLIFVNAIWFSPISWEQLNYLKPSIPMRPSPFNLNEFSEQPTPSMPLPDHPSSIYEFSLPISYNSLKPPLSQYRTVIPEFGNIDFNFREFYRLNLQPGGEDNLAEKGTLSPLYFDFPFAEAESDFETTATASESNFSLLGTFYLPNSVNGRSWQELIGQEINSSFPFNGFTPVPDTETTALEWRLKAKMIDLPVNTIQYRSLTNNSVYTLFFDKETGWLMNGTFYKSTGSWIDDFSAKTLKIDRYFMTMFIENSLQYYLLDLGLMVCVMLPSTLFLIISFIHYHKKGKSDIPSRFDKFILYSKTRADKFT